MAALSGRGVGRALHWATAILTVAVGVASDPGTAETLGGVYAVVGAAFIARAALVRPLGRPGPRMGPGARLAYLAVYRGLYVLLGIVIVTGLATGMAGPGVADAIGMDGAAMAAWHSNAYAALLALAAGHIVFSVWRGAALGEKPFDTMLPKI